MPEMPDIKIGHKSMKEYRFPVTVSTAGVFEVKVAEEQLAVIKDFKDPDTVCRPDMHRKRHHIEADALHKLEAVLSRYVSWDNEFTETREIFIAYVFDFLYEALWTICKLTDKMSEFFEDHETVMQIAKSKTRALPDFTGSS